ncbi:MAG: hypothetical protein QOK15_1955, partial [Nocardioidaceae bacterium]|nr:hypothetical protein [Nocardioidaceae bacterium]
MTSLTSARRRAEEFAVAVDAPEDHPTPPRLAELVDVVGRLRSHEPPSPSPDFSSALRERLLAEADQLLVQDAAPTPLRRQTRAHERRLAIAASAFVLVGGSAGLAAGAQNALPGDALYPVKRGLESAHTGLSLNRVDKGRDLLGQADNRLAEVQGLLADDSGALDLTQVTATIHDFGQQAQQGSQLLLDSYAQSQDSGIIVDVRRFAAGGLTALQDLTRNAPAQAQPLLARAALVVEEIDREAVQSCASCASAQPALRLPRMLLSPAEVDRVLDAMHGVQVGNDHPALGTTPPVGAAGGMRTAGTGSKTGGIKNSDGSSDGAGGTTGGDPGPSGGPPTGPSVPGLPGASGGSGGGNDLPGKLGKVPGKLGSKVGDTTT